MRRKLITFQTRLGIVLVTCAGIAVAVALSPTAASAADADIGACDPTCKNWTYVETSGARVNGPATPPSGVQGYGCPVFSAKPSKPAVMAGQTFNKNWSWPDNADANATFLALIASKNLKAAGESHTIEHTAPVSAKHFGTLVFTPAFYHSEGTFRWKEYMYDDFNTVIDQESTVTSDTPLLMGFTGPITEGEYSLVESPMTDDQHRVLCTNEPDPNPGIG